MRGGARRASCSTRSAWLADVNWHDLRADFIVPKDCPAQTLRLELANPRSEANVPGSVAVRLNGSLWFDDLRVRLLDYAQGG